MCTLYRHAPRSNSHATMVLICQPRTELTAANKTNEEIREFMGVDILMYQEVEDLKEAVTRKGEHNIDRPCMACLDGWYVTGDINEQVMESMENQRITERSVLK